MNVAPFNPLDMGNLAQSVGNALLVQEPVSLGEIPRFMGAGVYALYYVGDFSAYRDLAKQNLDGEFNQPIYVGKAVPKGGRKGVNVTTKTTALWSRLNNDHAKTLRLASNLNIEDFYARWLVVEPIWIPLGESVLISWFAPVWNALIDGYGNHDPGKGRYKGKNTRWDTLHPGRAWAEKLEPRTETPEDIEKDTTEYIRQRIDSAF